jgi:GAF domain-containing protein
MRRRSRAGGEPAKAPRRKTGARKSRIAPKAVRPRSSSAAREETKVARLTRERDEALQQRRATADENTRLLNEVRQRTDDLTEALERQTATSEVLKVISSSPGELAPVFKAILENAARICGAQFGTLNTYDGSAFRSVALHNPPPQFAIRRGGVIRPHPQSGLAHVARTKQIVHIDDIRTRPPYLERDKTVVGLADLAGARTILIVPMLHEDTLVGAITIYRQEVRPFTDKQIELLQSFAAQAVIAIENARLLNELRQRTSDLTESLEQQTATSEVLQVVSSSPGDLEPVFASMLENAVRICDATFGNIYRRDGDALHLVAARNTPPAFAAEARRRSPLEQQTATSEVLRVISQSPGELDPVFQTVLESATRICEAQFGHFFLVEGRDFRVVALQSVALTYPGWLKRGSKLAPLDNPHGPLAQLDRTKKIVHITDLAAEQAYIERNARMVALVESSGARTFLGVPLFKEETLIGAIAIYRQEVRPFTDKQIELVRNFAAQAVIAIENVRLLNELRESLQQQTATAEVLKVISSSPSDSIPCSTQC